MFAATWATHSLTRKTKNKQELKRNGKEEESVSKKWLPKKISINSPPNCNDSLFDNG